MDAVTTVVVTLTLAFVFGLWSAWHSSRQLAHRRGRNPRPGYLPTSPASTATKPGSAPTRTRRHGRSDGPTLTIRTHAEAYSSSGQPGDQLAGSAILQQRLAQNSYTEPGDCGCSKDSDPGQPPPSVDSDDQPTEPLPTPWDEPDDPQVGRVIDAVAGAIRSITAEGHDPDLREINMAVARLQMEWMDQAAYPICCPGCGLVWDQAECDQALADDTFTEWREGVMNHPVNAKGDAWGERPRDDE